MKKTTLIFLLFINSIIFAQIKYGDNNNTQYQQFLRNGEGAALYINQINTSEPILRLSSGTASPNVNVKLTVENNGSIGVGTIVPNEKLHMVSDLNTIIKLVTNSTSSANSSGIIFQGKRASSTHFSTHYIGTEGDSHFNLSINADEALKLKTNGYDQLTITTNGYIGIGTSSPEAKLNVISSSTIGLSDLSKSSVLIGKPSAGLGFDQNEIVNKGYDMNIGTLSNGKNIIFKAGGNINRMFINGTNGNIGIGTTSPDSKLAVDGTIHSKEVKVDLIGWPDYVFEKDYELPSLEEVEKHIKEKGHLEDIPTAEDVEKNGLQLGRMNKKMLQKIEELTLYTIQQEKRIKKIETVNSELKKQNEKIKTLEEKINFLLKKTQ